MSSRTDIPPLKCLLAFRSVARRLSVSRAADELCVTHSAVSQSIRRLEEQLGHSLFIRSGHSLSLTEQGEYYLRSIQGALSQLEVATAQQLALHNHSLLTVNLPSTLAIRWLIPMLGDFQHTHPEVDLRLSTLQSGTWDFFQDRIDAAILLGNPEQWPDCHSHFLVEDQLVMIASPALDAINKNPKQLFSSFKTIVVTNPLRKHDLESWCQYNHCKPPQRKQCMGFSNSAQALEAVKNGLGIMVTHAAFIHRDLTNKTVVSLGDDYPVDGQAYYLRYPKTYESKSSLRAWKNWLLHALEKKP
jgi:LysR family transcriptional regulator, glycine cleavage system transcriptional activator